MIEIRVPKEIRAYKEKIFFGMNLRQLICSIITLSINVPMYWYGRKYIGDEAISWIVIITAMPLFCIGFFSYNGMNFEQFIVAFMQSEFLYPQKRKYESEDLYQILIHENKKIEDKNKEKSNSIFNKINKQVNINLNIKKKNDKE